MPGVTVPSAEVVDGVRRFPRSGLKVVIVGAGVGGLLAGLECWRKGHDVQILERSHEMSKIGDCVTIGPSGLCTLGNYPKMHVKYNEKMYNSPVSFWSPSGRKFFQEEAEWHLAPEHAASSHQKEISFQKSRAEFASMLLEQIARIGVPVFWGRKVTFYEEDVLSGEARVRTESGEVFTGDIVVAADGVHTKSHSIIAGEKIDSYSSGYSVSRVSFPRSALAPGSKGHSILPGIQERSQFRIYPSDDMHLMLMLNQDWCGFAFTHPDKSDNADESWSNHISKEALVKTLSEKREWDPAVVDFLSQVPETAKIVDWKLTWRDPRPNWVSAGGRIVQLGDSAHSFLPTSGNGAVQAMEDAISLPECLRLGGKEGAPWATKVHNLLRFERTAMMQKKGFINRERLHHSQGKLEESRSDDEARHAVATIHHAGPRVWNHNPERYATENYDAALGHLRYGNNFKNTNLPLDEEYHPWTIDEVVQSEKAKREIE